MCFTGFLFRTCPHILFLFFCLNIYTSLSHECFPVPQRPCTILRDAPPRRGTVMVNLLRRRFLAIAVVLVFLLDRVVLVIVIGWCTRRWGDCGGGGGIVMAGLSTTVVPLTLLGTAANVVVVVAVDRWRCVIWVDSVVAVADVVIVVVVAAVGKSKATAETVPVVIQLAK